MSRLIIDLDAASISAEQVFPTSVLRVLARTIAEPGLSNTQVKIYDDVL